MYVYMCAFIKINIPKPLASEPGMIFSLLHESMNNPVTNQVTVRVRNILCSMTE
jgi:hypothetical protein